MNKKNISNQIKREKQYLMVMFGVLVLLVLSYMYFVSMSIVEVVMRQEASRDIRSLQTEIALLETTYIDAQHAISADIASLQGFVQTADKIFLDRTPSSLVLREIP